MTRRTVRGLAAVAALVFSSHALAAAPGQAESAAARAVKASPDLTAQLAQEIGSTPDQAAGVLK